MKLHAHKLVISGITLCLIFLCACSDKSADNASQKAIPAEETAVSAAVDQVQQEEKVGEPLDVIARVGDQTITFTEINTMINSAAIVGLSMPNWAHRNVIPSASPCCTS